MGLLEFLRGGVRRLKRSPSSPVPLGRGYVDRAVQGRDAFQVSGWLFAPGRWIERFELRLDGVVTAELQPARREDVVEALGDWPEARQSGFVFDVSSPTPLCREGALLEVEGYCGREVVARIRFRYFTGFHEGFPDPPPSLRFRVTNGTHLETYWLGGLQTYQEFQGAIDRWCSRERVRRLLDWGCGCGRVTSFFLRDYPGAEIHGCDIDREAIEWSRETLGPRFSVVEPFPPTAYRGGMFDVVVGYSVLTHLERRVQTEWLGEVRRLLAPGGLFLATVHGDFVAKFAGDPRVERELAESEISDSTLDPNLDGIAPEGYYRGCYQSQAYTVREFSRFFDVLEYLPQAMTNFQDLVVLRRR